MSTMADLALAQLMQQMKKVASTEKSTNPYGSELFIQFLQNPVYIPDADLYPSQGPVPEGTINGYGTALWIPSGYPIATQPYLDSWGRVIMRPLRLVSNINSQAQLNTITAYVMAALQYAVQKYSASPYNVNNQTKLWSGPMVVQSYFIAPPSDKIAIQTRLTMGSWDPDWANPSFPQPTLLDAAFNAGKTLVMSVFSAGLSQIVPGLGAQLENAVNRASDGGITGLPSINATAQGAQESATEKSLLNTAPSMSNILIIAIAVIIILFLI